MQKLIMGEEMEGTDDNETNRITARSIIDDTSEVLQKNLQSTCIVDRVVRTCLQSLQD